MTRPCSSLRLFFYSPIFGPSDWFRTSGLVVPNHALYHLSYTRIFSFFGFLPLWSKMWSNGGFRSYCGSHEVPKLQCLQGIAGFRISTDRRGCYTLPNQARYQTSLNPEIFGCFAGRGGNAATELQQGYYTGWERKKQWFFLPHERAFCRGCGAFCHVRGVFRGSGIFCRASGLPAVGRAIAAHCSAIPGKALL